MVDTLHEKMVAAAESLGRAVEAHRHKMSDAVAAHLASLPPRPESEPTAKETTDAST